MSGATVIRQRRELYELRLATASISFMPEPGRPGPTSEQRFHAEAARRFEATLAPLAPGFGQALARLADEHRDEVALLPLDDSLPEVLAGSDFSLKRFLAEGNRACRCALRVGSPPDGVALDDCTLELAFARLPEPDALARFHAAVVAELHRILGVHRRAEQRSARVGPPRAHPQAEFHYARWSGEAAGVEDLNGRPDGRTLEAVLADGPLEPERALHLSFALAEIFAVAEADGAIHPDPGPADVILDDDDVVAVAGFGTTRHGNRSRAPEGRPDFFVGAAAPPDWRARQAWSLGFLLAALHAPGLDELAARLQASGSADRPTAEAAFRIVARTVGRRDLTKPRRRSPSKLAARAAGDAPGILQPCGACGRLAMPHSSRDVWADAAHSRRVPDCCWRARARRQLLLVAFAVIAVAVAAFAWWR